MRPFKIVLTGGPCAGKTTQIENLKDFLTKKGYKVIVIKETATELIDAGFDYKLIGSLINFQDLILKHQYFKEESADSTLKSIDEKVIILYDRATLDNKAYFDNYKDFDYLLKSLPESEIDILDQYDLVIDLESAAVCHPEYYNLNNKARTETVEEAKERDFKTSAAWVGHRNMHFINFTIPEEKEFEIIKNIVEDNLMFQRKRIVRKRIENTLSDFENYDDNNSRLIDVNCFKLNFHRRDYELRLYQRSYKGNTSYIYTVKEPGEDVFYEVKKLTPEERMEIAQLHWATDQWNYKMLSFVKNGTLFEIKFYDDGAILQYEEKEFGEEVIFPEEIKFPKEKILK